MARDSESSGGSYRERAAAERAAPTDDLLTATDPGTPPQLTALLERVWRIETLTETRRCAALPACATMN